MINEEIRYKIQELPVFQYLLRLILIAWTYFAYTKYEVNPAFFIATIVVTVVIFFYISETSIIANTDCIIIKHNRWLPFLTSKRKIYYSEINDIIYNKSKLDIGTLILSILDIIPGKARTDAQLVFVLKNDPQFNFNTIGSKKQNDELVSFIKNEIKQKINEFNFRQ